VTITDFDRCQHCRFGLLVFQGCAEGWQFICARCGKMTIFSDQMVGLLVDEVEAELRAALE
jgi:DNA-directed RNA polymerase subunit RPC12/RpoP